MVALIGSTSALRIAGEFGQLGGRGRRPVRGEGDGEAAKHGALWVGAVLNVSGGIVQAAGSRAGCCPLRSGLSQTEPIGSQLRVGPLHRVGFSALARS